MAPVLGRYFTAVLPMSPLIKVLRYAIAAIVLAFASPASAVTLEQFGGGSNVADNTAAWNAMMASMPNGGKVDLGCTTYRFLSGISVPNYVHVEGCGGDTSVIDCSGITTAQPCVTISGYRQKLQSVMVRGSSAAGVLITSAAFIVLEDVGVTDTRTPDSSPWDDNCIDVYNSWRVTIEEPRLVNCRSFAISATGYGTTLRVVGGYADSPKKSGVHLNGITYFHFDNFAVDHAVDYAIWAHNVASGVFTAQGGEFNGKGMFLFTASDTEAAGVIVPDVSGIVIVAPFSFDNGKSRPFFSSLIEASSQNGRRIDITLSGGYEHTSPNGRSIIATGSGVRISRTGGTLKGGITVSGGAVVTTLF